jgi:hypothetical protein
MITLFRNTIVASAVWLPFAARKTVSENAPVVEGPA